MKLHRSIYSQLFPYQSGEENNPTAPAFPAPAGAMRPVESSLPNGTGDNAFGSDIPQPAPHQPDQRLNPVIASEQVITPTAEESVTIDEGNMPVVDQGQPINTPPIETTQLQRLQGPDRDPILVERMAELRRAPMDQMELYGGSTGGGARAPMPMGTPNFATPDMPAPGAKAKKVKKTFAEQHPNFKYPYPNPENEEQVAANATAEMREQSQNPVNQDKGWKGLVKELLENFSYGLSKTPAGANWKQALLLGGVGAGAGFVNKGWNERRAAEAALPGLMEAEQMAGQRVQRERGWQDKQRDNQRQELDLIRKTREGERKYEIQIRTLDWKKEDRDRYYELEEIKQDARERNDEKTYNLAVERQREIERHNLKTEGQAEKNEVGRMARAGQSHTGAKFKLKGMSEAGMNQRQQTAAALAKALADYKTDKSEASRKRILEYQKQLADQ